MEKYEKSGFDKQSFLLKNLESADRTADTCKNCAKCGKGFKIGTNEAYNIKIKIRVGYILKIFCFCLYASVAAPYKGISLKKKLVKKFLLNFMN